MEQDGRCAAWRRFFETISPEAIGRLDELMAADVHFRDPFNNVRGLRPVKRVYHSIFAEVDDPRFTVSHCACVDEICFLRWHFTCRPKVIGRGHPWVIDGVTELHFNEAGKVVAQVDHWDAGQSVYERIPGFGFFIRLVRKRIGRHTGRFE